MSLKNKPIPIFIFSLPRSGSTLLQRILATDQRIATIAEPWILLPITYAYRKNGILSEYSHITSWTAHLNVGDCLRKRGTDYHELIANYASEVYNWLSNGAPYFLDKTPRYFLIIREIERMFPTGKFIFLFRNPAAVFSSVMNTWHNGRLYFPHNYVDLYKGPFLLAKGYNRLKDRSIKIKYEDLVSDPMGILNKIYSYLSIPFDKSIILRFCETKLGGTVGDISGKDKRYLDTEPLVSWRYFYNSRFRKKVLKRYLEHLGDTVLSTFGFNKKAIYKEVANIPIRWRYAVSDHFFWYLSNILQKTGIHCWWIKAKAARDDKHMPLWYS